MLFRGVLGGGLGNGGSFIDGSEVRGDGLGGFRCFYNLVLRTSGNFV